jgi:hypothetical protein
MVVSMSHMMFGGFRGQVKPAHYPAGWHEVEQILEQDQSTQATLFLPWHGYMIMSFANYHTIHNPASGFFSSDIVAGKTIDNAYLKETEQKEWDDIFFKTLHGFDSLDHHIGFLQANNISHIILAKEADWDRYSFLDESTYLSKIYDNERIALYRVEYDQ